MISAQNSKHRVENERQSFMMCVKKKRSFTRFMTSTLSYIHWTLLYISVPLVVQLKTYHTHFETAQSLPHLRLHLPPALQPTVLRIALDNLQSAKPANLGLSPRGIVFHMLWLPSLSMPPSIPHASSISCLSSSYFPLL